ncbi:MAG TPA: zinc metallopeptidase [Bacillota bacterium]|nr:zinc metallopeptidase [Bacillota bacterium]
MFFWNDPTFLLLIPAILFSLYAQFKVQSTFNKYLDVQASSGMTGAQVARDILDSNQLQDVPVELTPGTLSDHYDPRGRVLRLSPEVYHGRSLASLGVAAHESGHAIQHAQAYAPLAIRNGIYPVANFGSTLGYILFFIGLFFGGGASTFLLDLGIILFSFFVFFTVLTLPVEFNASSRAMRTLSEGGYLRGGDELYGAKKVLSAAAMTYVAAAATAILNLVRMLLIRGSRDE